MMAQTVDGRWAAATTGREMPRQNGKGDEIEVVELWGLVQRGEAIMHTVHDAVLLATQAQQRLLSVLEGHADLRRKVKRVWRGTGQQMIETRNGGVVWYRTRTGGGGRGVDDVDRVVVDEAQHAQVEHVEAIAPTLLANPNPQLNAVGTAGLAGKSGWWWTVRKRALSSDPGAFGYVGHTAETVSLDEAGRVTQGSVDVQDRGLWLAANPAIAAGRGGGIAFLEEQLRRMGPESFAREHLCVWDAPPGEQGGDIDMSEWESCLDGASELEDPVVFGIDVSPDQSWAAIAAAGTSKDGRRHVEVVDHRPGTKWVVDRLVDLVNRWSPGAVGLCPSTQAGLLLPELENEQIEVQLLDRREYALGCAGLLSDITDGRLVHTGQEQLTDAVSGATIKASGELWVWNRKDTTVDLSPLVAVTVAHQASLTSGKPEPVFAW